MKYLIVAIALCVPAVGAGPTLAQGLGESGSKPLNPSSARITTRAPEPDKWNSMKTRDGSRRIFKCKPLACSDPQTVAFTFQKSPVKKPNPEALEKFAKIDLPKSIRAAGAAREVLSDGAEKIETLVSETATLKGYPSVINESKLLRGSTSTYLEIAIIFAGPVMIRVQSTSPSQEQAKKSLTEFIDLMQIDMGPAPGIQPRPGHDATRSL